MEARGELLATPPLTPPHLGRAARRVPAGRGTLAIITSKRRYLRLYYGWFTPAMLYEELDGAKGRNCLKISMLEGKTFFFK